MIEFIVYGTPAPQGSKRYVGHSVKKSAKGGRATATMVESSKKVKPWRKAVEAAAMMAMCVDAVDRNGGLKWDKPRFPLDGPLVARMVFTLPRPAAAKGRKHPDRMPDLDKLARSTGDALQTAGLIADDARIVGYSRLWKAYPGGDPEALDRPGVRIRIEPLDGVSASLSALALSALQKTQSDARFLARIGFDPERSVDECQGCG